MVSKTKTFISVDISEEVKKELKEIALEEERTLSDIVREAIDFYLATR